MSAISIELRKERRTGAAIVLPAVGLMGSLYAFANFLVRGETLLSLPLDPMDILLTQLYGMIVVLNMFGAIVATCTVYGLEFRGGAIKKMLVMPLSMAKIYASKLLVLAVGLLLAVAMQNGALALIGSSSLPPSSCDMGQVLVFAGYSLATSMPVLTFMLLVSSRFENMWIPLGMGVAGFLSAVALAGVDLPLTLVHPFVVMLKPAIAMSAQPDIAVLAASAAHTAVFLAAGVWLSGRGHYE
ncbi:ABC transporter permease [Olsenella massiliensis]|uniref:ABC transporter permease n=1 Tax=Olsenella massiliensis TaxID=1622075 RepID=UPI00071E114B|nr:ABC transporter permease [Olsenella massiliensis]